MNKFKVGDIIKGNKLSDRRYGITNTEMTKAVVMESRKGYIDVKILEHLSSYEIGEWYYGLEEECFDLVEESKPSKNKSVDKIEIKEESEGTYIIINEKITIFTTAKKDEIGIVDTNNIKPDLETAKLIAVAKTKLN